MGSLLANQGGTWTDNGPVGEEQHIANRFTVSAIVDLTGYRWYCLQANNSAYKPSRLTLWNATDDAVVETITTIATPSTTGWQALATGGGLQLVPGKTYELSWGGAAGSSYHRPIQADSSAAAPSSPWAWASPKGGFNYTYNVDKSGTFPYITGIDVEGDLFTGSGAPPGSEPANGTLNPSSSLAWWLHKDTQNIDSAPKLVWTLLQEIKAELGDFASTAGDTLFDHIGDIETILNNIPTRQDGEWTVVQKLWQIAGALTNLEIAAWDLFAKRAPSQLTGASGGGGSAFYGPNGTQVSGGVEYLIEHAGDGTLFEKLREQLQLTPSPASDPRWNLAATVTGTGAGVVGTGADLYRLTVTLGPGSRPGVSFGAGLDWHRYLGWVAPVRDGFVAERHKLEWLQSEWRWPPHFLHGLVISVGPADDWSCECWQLDR